MYKLESKKFWRIFKKICSLVLVLTFTSAGLPLEGFAAESTNYRLATFVMDSAGNQGVGTDYELNQHTFGESINGDLESANTKTRAGYLHTIVKDEAEPPAPPAGSGYLAESENFRQQAYLLSIANAEATSSNFNIPLASAGEPVGGILAGYYEKSFSGFVYTILGNAPILTQNIPAQSWQMNTTYNNALDLDDYFVDPDGDDLTFIASGNTNITVTIDPLTHQVSFSPSAGFVGVEEIIITAVDLEGHRTLSHPITLNVYQPGVNNPPVLEYIADIEAKEGELIKLTPQATDPDNNPITYSFSPPFNEQGEWQTDYESAGVYYITVTASDGALTDSQEVEVMVLNVNRKPQLDYIPDITGPENELITITPTATDPDGDELTFSFSPPFNDQGQWLPSYHNAGVYIVTVTASDGSLSDSQDVLVNITNVNTTPTVSISLDRINAAVDEQVTFIVYAADEDDDELTLILQKDGSQFYSGSVYEFYVGTTSFSSLGTHTITAIVDDGHGGEASDTVNIEIIDPEDLWNKILPLLGDFNGDGLVDIGTYNRDTGRWAVALSNIGGFGSVTEWLSSFGASTDWQYVNGDFNGDGKTDIAIFNQSNGQWKVGTSDGAGFTDQGVWATFSGASSDWIPLTGDFNGDGVSDVGTYNKSSGEVKCALSNKTSFNSPATWISGLAHSDEAKPFSGDFNGDGLTEVGVFNEGSWSFTTSDGTQFLARSDWNVSFGGEEERAVIGDFNNDGLTDIGAFYKDSGRWQIYHSTGDGFISSGDWLNDFGAGEYNTVYALDFNGDGLTDAAVFDNSNFSWQRLAAQGEVGDLLSKITNSLGGTTEITYKSSVHYDNTGDDDEADLPFAIQTVSQVKQGDGLGNLYQTNYSYANGLYAAEERELRGFGYVKVKDAEGNISETWFKQDDIFKGLPEKTRISDSYGKLYLETLKTYDYTTPYIDCTFAFLSEEETATYEGQITPKTYRTTYEYDGYGNPTRIANVGDVEIAGDEKESNIEYVYNLNLWILGLPAHTYLKDAQGEIVSQKWLYYDGQENYTDSPIKGDLTKEENWLNTPGKSNPITQKSYDDYGNVLTTTDARGNVTTITYDTTAYIYPEIVTNQLGHTVENTYDFRTGQILTSTDPNGQTTINEYDVFGRISQVFGPNDDAQHPSTWYEYDLSTTPAKITVHLREEYNTDDPAKIRTSFSFIDGLGRNIQTKTDADDPTKQIVSNVVTFNSRGKVEHKYLPYFTDKSSEYTLPDLNQPKATYEYDGLGRMIKQTNPDSTYQTIEYFPGKVTTTDENGHRINKYQDAHRQLIKIEEFNHGQIYVTRYEYDAQGNLLRTIDDHGNIASISYDSLGRKILMDDPDMGSWSYDYDASGNLISQTDAKSQVLEFRYDELNRLTHKLANTQTIVTYYYDDPTKPNCIGRLSRIEDQSGQTEFFYDNLGREIKSIKTVDNVAYTVERTYDALDRLKTLTYPDGEVVTYTYTFSGGIKTIVGNRTYVSNVTYTASGQMSAISYGNNTYTDYEYNPQTLRLEHLTTNDGALQDLHYQFDNVGNITNINDFLHSATQSFGYDDLNRLTSAVGETYGAKTYRYDSIGNIIEKGDLILTYGEGAGPHAVTSLRGAAGEEAISITYDANGNMLSKGEATFTYDLENRLISVTSPLSGSGAGETVSFDLTLSAGWNYISLPIIPDDGQISAIFSELEFGQDYDQVSQYNPDTEDFDNYNNTSYNQFESLEFARGYLVYVPNSSDVNLSITGQLNLEQTYQLKAGWNLIGTPSAEELTVAEALNNLQEGIDYDTIVRYNRDTQLFENLSANDLLQPGTAYYLHCLQDTTWQIQAARETTTFVYDGDGGRVKKTTPTQTTTYIGSLYEIRDTGDERLIKKHIFLGSNRISTVNTPTGEPANSQTYFYHSDHLGSSNIITDSLGEVVQRLEYRPYGETQINAGYDGVTYKFTGKELDASTGLYFYGARYYDPELGRFITADPTIQRPYDPQDLNRYAYARNNPIRYIDPTGYGWWSDFWERIWDWFQDEVIQPLISFTITLVFSGGNFVAATAAAISTVVLDTGEGRQFIRRTAKEVFDDIFGMSPKWAYMVSGVVIHTATSLALERVIANLAASPVGAKQFNEQTDAQYLEKSQGYDSWGRNPEPFSPEKGYGGFTKEEILTLRWNSNNEVAGFLGVSPKEGGLRSILGIPVKHSSATAITFPFDKTIKPTNKWFYGNLFGVCHQAANASLLKSGISNVITDFIKDWEFRAATYIYGNYGGGLPQKIYQGTIYYQE